MSRCSCRVRPLVACIAVCACLVDPAQSADEQGSDVEISFETAGEAVQIPMRRLVPSQPDSEDDGHGLAKKMGAQTSLFGNRFHDLRGENYGQNRLLVSGCHSTGLDQVATFGSIALGTGGVPGLLL